MHRLGHTQEERHLLKKYSTWYTMRCCLSAVQTSIKHRDRNEKEGLWCFQKQKKKTLSELISQILMKSQQKICKVAVKMHKETRSLRPGVGVLRWWLNSEHQRNNLANIFHLDIATWGRGGRTWVCGTSEDLKQETEYTEEWGEGLQQEEGGDKWCLLPKFWIAAWNGVTGTCRCTVTTANPKILHGEMQQCNRADNVLGCSGQWVLWVQMFPREG